MNIKSKDTYDNGYQKLYLGFLPDPGFAIQQFEASAEGAVLVFNRKGRKGVAKGTVITLGSSRFLLWSVCFY